MHLKDAFDVLGSEDLASVRARGMGSPWAAPLLGRRRQLTRFKKYSTRVVITFRDVEARALSPEMSRETKTTVVGQRGLARLLAIYCPVKRRVKGEKRGSGGEGGRRKKRGANGRVPAVIQRDTSVFARQTHSDGNA